MYFYGEAVSLYVIHVGTDKTQANLGLCSYLWLHAPITRLNYRCRWLENYVSDWLLPSIRLYTRLRTGRDQHTDHCLPWLRRNCHLILPAFCGEHYHEHLSSRQEQEHCICLDGWWPTDWLQYRSGTRRCVCRNNWLALGVPYFCHYQQCCVHHSLVWIAQGAGQEERRLDPHQA